MAVRTLQTRFLALLSFFFAGSALAMAQPHYYISLAREGTTMHASGTTDTGSAMLGYHEAHATVTLKSPSGRSAQASDWAIGSIVVDVYLDLLQEYGYFTANNAGSVFCEVAQRTISRGCPQISVNVPQVALSVESEMETMSGAARVLLGADKNTTAFTAAGVPNGGTYQWSLGPRLAFFFGSPSQGAATVYGTSPSTSGQDTSIQVTYLVSGQSASASMPITVDNPTTIVANLPGKLTSVASGYVLTIQYTAYDQLGDPIPVPDVYATETLSTVSSTPPNITFNPPDNTPLPISVGTQGTFWDSLSATSPGGLPSDFNATRQQSWTLSGYLLIPVNTQYYGPTSASTTTSVFTH